MSKTNAKTPRFRPNVNELNLEVLSVASVKKLLFVTNLKVAFTYTTANYAA